MAELIQYTNEVPGIKWPLNKTIVRIGRSGSGSEISLDDAYASKLHAQIEIMANDDRSGVDYYIRDMQSTNHTYLNQIPVEYIRLSHNDTVVIGKSKFVFFSEGVREYLSLENVQNYSADLSAKESDESLAIALEEITKEIKSVLANSAHDPESSLYKFSRRLNLN